MNRTAIRGILAFLIMSAAVLLNASAALGSDNQQQSEPVVHASAGSNGRIVPSGDVVVGWGGSRTFRMIAAPGYHVESVLVNGVSVGAVTRYTLSQLNADASISVTFAQDTNKITVGVHGPGMISPRGIVEIPDGEDQVFIIAPLTGSIVADVQVDGISIGAVTSYTFRNVRRPHTIRATFTLSPNLVTASAIGNGTIFPSGTVVIPPSGGDQTFVMLPAEHYHVCDVLVDGVSVGAVPLHKFTNVSGRHTIQATFELNSNPITTSTNGNGSISPNGVVAVGYGSDKTFRITAADGYHVADLLVDGASVGAVNAYRFEDVTASHTISARFAVNGTRRIITAAGTGGTIEPVEAETGIVLMMNGENKTFAIIPNRKYYVADVQVDGMSVGPVTTYTFMNVTADHTITATFATRMFTLTAISGAHGSISPSGEIQVPCGGSQGFSMVADEGYVLEAVIVDGRSVEAETEWTLSDITESHTIYAAFHIESWSNNNSDSQRMRSFR